MQTKRCFKCGRELPLSEFYRHPQMGDGHLNKCKDCTKKDVKINYDRKSTNEEWMEKERTRGREKFRRLGYKNRFKKTRSILPNGGNICRKLKVIGFDMSGKEAHHWNYNNPNSVFILSRKAHKRLHRHLIVNYDDKFCYTEHGKRLENAIQAKLYFMSILKRYDINEVPHITNIN